MSATLHVNFLPYRVAGKEHMFEVVTPSRTFYVQVDKEEDMQDWVRALQELLKAVKPSLQVKFTCPLTCIGSLGRAKTK